MIVDQLRTYAAASPEAPFLLTPERAWSYQASFEIAGRLAARLKSLGLKHFGLCLPDGPEAILLMLAADAAGATLCLVNPRFTPDEVRQVRDRFDLERLVVAAPDPALGEGLVEAGSLFRDCESAAYGRAPEPSSDPSSRCLVLTTGTTGAPKGAVYAWNDLLAQTKRHERFARTRWLLVYHLNHFAGLQVLAHVLANGATVVIPASRDMAEVLAAIRRHGVEFISATPTFWRLFNSAVAPHESADLPVRQITIGGEAVTSDVLEGLRQRLPQARISQVYATTELGSCFSVRDGEKGFPVSFLTMDGDDASARDVDLKIVDGQLHVRSRRGMMAYYGDAAQRQGTWQPTGDLVRIDGDRVVFLGRLSEVINVGGVKVHPIEVEDVILRLPEVRNAHVYGRPNPITGNIIVADVVPAPCAAGAEGLVNLVRNHCERELDRYRQPRLVRVVAELAEANDKVLRRAAVEPSVV